MFRGQKRCIRATCSASCLRRPGCRPGSAPASAAGLQPGLDGERREPRRRDGRGASSWHAATPVSRPQFDPHLDHTDRPRRSAARHPDSGAPPGRRPHGRSRHRAAQQSVPHQSRQATDRGRSRIAPAPSGRRLSLGGPSEAVRSRKLTTTSANVAHKWAQRSVHAQIPRLIDGQRQVRQNGGQAHVGARLRGDHRTALAQQAKPGLDRGGLTIGGMGTMPMVLR